MIRRLSIIGADEPVRDASYLFERLASRSGTCASVYHTYSAPAKPGVHEDHSHMCKKFIHFFLVLKKNFPQKSPQPYFGWANYHQPHSE